MPRTRITIRRAQGSDRIGGVRWMAQAEFPGGRHISLESSRNRPPARVAARLAVVKRYTVAANSGAAPPPSGGGSPGGDGGGHYVPREYEQLQ